MNRLDDVKYNFKSLSVPGGGFVTGFLFHHARRDILYCRTDIGGIYRFEFGNRRWKYLGGRFTEYDHHLTQPLSLAIDEQHPDKLYAICGDSRKGIAGGKASLLISDDCGDSFIEKAVPFCCNGNSPARSCAERLAYKNGRLFFGSKGEGLWCSANEGDSWEKLSLCEENIVFVYFPHNTGIMIVSCTGETSAEGSNRGHTLYVSYDLGASFEKLATPDPLGDSRCSHNGFVAGGVAESGSNVYITFTHSFMENRWGGWNDFACDNGGGFDGRLYRYVITNGRLAFDKDITPFIDSFSDGNAMRRLPFGLGGVDADGDIIAVCSIGGHGDAVFISKDGGSSYTTITSTDLERFSIDVPYLKPQYNGGRIPLHWMSCLRIDPFNTDLAVINTGTGVFALEALTSDKPYISTLCNGIEETVHMNIYGIPKGKNHVIDLVGDLGGFAFSKLDEPCENSFADADGHRYITCLNADYVQSAPDTFIATARGNWTGHTHGGVILTHDGGDNFSHIGYPNNISDRLDETIQTLKRPNTNSGWAAITADASAVLWTLAHQWGMLPCFAAVRYDIASQSFSKIRIYDLYGKDISDSDVHIKIFTDRISSSHAYGFGENGQLYISTDGGSSFRQASVSGGLPLCRMSGIDGAKGCEIRFLPTQVGVCYAALISNGLWRLKFGENAVSAERITGNGDLVKTVGFGKGLSEDTPALYISGNIMGEYGFWRSFDSGESWAKINTDTQMYGNIVSMDGDMRKMGRVYIATATHGGLYGEPYDKEKQNGTHL